MEFFEASAKDNVNVESVFHRLVEIICRKMEEKLDGDLAASSGQSNTGVYQFWDRKWKRKEMGGGGEEEGRQRVK